MDISPNRIYKFDGNKWIEVNKNMTQSYLFDKEYIRFLVDKIGSGEYELDNLTESEKMEIEEYLRSTQNT